MIAMSRDALQEKSNHLGESFARYAIKATANKDLIEVHFVVLKYQATATTEVRIALFNLLLFLFLFFFLFSSFYEEDEKF